MMFVCSSKFQQIKDISFFTMASNYAHKGTHKIQRKSCIITFTEFGVLVNNLYFSFCVS